MLERQLRIQADICVVQCLTQLFGHRLGELVEGADDVGVVDVVAVDKGAGAKEDDAEGEGYGDGVLVKEGLCGLPCRAS